MSADLEPCYFKQLKPVGSHKLDSTWEFVIAPKIITSLDGLGVVWTSIDVVRIGIVEESEAPVVLWIGVKPRSLATQPARIVAFRCLDILQSYGINDVDVEIRESSIIPMAEPMLLPPAERGILDVVSAPFTHTLGLQISPSATPWHAGTGGFFMTRGKDLVLVTARHVAISEDELPNAKTYEYEDPVRPYLDMLPYAEHEDPVQPKLDVLLLGDEAYAHCVNAIEQMLEEKLTPDDCAALQAFKHDVCTDWASHESCILGHVVYSPPICYGARDEQCTQDYAVIQIADGKINRTTFNGNVIDIGPSIDPEEFAKKMLVDEKKHGQRFRMLRGIIPDSELRTPKTLDKNDEPGLMVMMNGSRSGITIGRASHLVSFTRQDPDDQGHGNTSKEWPILPYNHKGGPFSRQGDSGSVIVDGLGRMGGLLHAGAGVADFIDVTYATPITFIVNGIEDKYPNAGFDFGSV